MVTWAVKEFAKKMQRAKFSFYFPKRGKGLGAEMSISTEGWGALSFY